MEGNQEKFCQPRTIKKFKKVDDDNDDNDDSPWSLQSPEIDLEIDQNPFHIQVILDVVFKMLSFENVKKFRLISSTWNEVGILELSRRPQKPIRFNKIDDLGLEDDDKLGEMVRIKRLHKELFFGHEQEFFFYNFSFNIKLLTRPQIDQVLHHFSPKFVEFYGHPIMKYIELPNGRTREEEVDEESDPQLFHLLSKFLIKISLTVQEIQYDDLYIYFGNNQTSFEPDQELALTKFPNLRQILIKMYRHNSNLKKMFIYPIIGHQNSPKLRHLTIGSASNNNISLGSQEEIKEMLEPTGLIPKLQFLELYNVDQDLLNGLADFAQNGMLKLTKLIFVNYTYEYRVNINEIFVRLIATQAESLKILELSIPYSTSTVIQVPFPTLPNLTFLQIDNFLYFEAFYKPINFSLQFPKLQEFRTNSIKRFLHKNLGQGGESVKCVILDKMYPHGEVMNNAGSDSTFPRRVDFIKFGQIFPNLEILELDVDAMPLFNSSPVLENLPFWSKLRKVVFHCQFYDITHSNLPLLDLKVIKKLEIVVNCVKDSMMDEKSYMTFLGDLVLELEENDDNSDHYDRQKFYKKFLATILKDFDSIRHTITFTIVCYNISEDFKRDFRAIFPETNFVCSRFIATD